MSGLAGCWGGGGGVKHRTSQWSLSKAWLSLCVTVDKIYKFRQRYNSHNFI